MDEDNSPDVPEDSESARDAERLSAHEIFATVVRTGEDELDRSLPGLGISAVAGGITVGLSALAMALVHGSLGPGRNTHLLEAALYPIGFIAVVIGRAQFFTENTLFPVITYLARPRPLLRILTFWAVVLGGNLAGAWLFAILVMETSALAPVTRANLVMFGMELFSPRGITVFWSAVIGGWLMALVAWMVSASQWTSGQIMVTWFLTFLIGLGGFAHCIASSTELACAVLAGQLGFGSFLDWFWAGVLGNLAGGVVIVSLLNFGQVKWGGGSRGGTETGN